MRLTSIKFLEGRQTVDLDKWRSAPSRDCFLSATRISQCSLVGGGRLRGIWERPHFIHSFLE